MTLQEHYEDRLYVLRCGQIHLRELLKERKTSKAQLIWRGLKGAYRRVMQCKSQLGESKCG